MNNTLAVVNLQKQKNSPTKSLFSYAITKGRLIWQQQSIIFLIMLIAACIQPFTAEVQAAPPVPFFSRGNDPVVITADTLTYDQNRRQAVYAGSVTAKQKDTTLECDKLTIILSPKELKLDQVIASGNKVIIRLQKKKAVCQTAHYYATERKLILSGHPILDDGKNTITGNAIIFYLDEDRSVVKGGRDHRVKTTIFPGNKNLGIGWK